ncbi:putative protein tyrosine kinase [Lyophyllum shimeji]|uniref:Uncharacterized protein n=1 Tax=Lyophyllum shimeji TaxID=47721 RepID=A0A9P3PL67_LYOSH|nr:putative protein tyrosine kinase [Lyophyllum shimeji]
MTLRGASSRNLSSSRNSSTPYSRRPGAAQPTSRPQQISTCGACRMRRVRCDLKDIPFTGVGPRPQCSNCKERGLKRVNEFAKMKTVRLPRGGRELVPEVEPVYDYDHLKESCPPDLSADLEDSPGGSNRRVHGPPPGAPRAYRYTPLVPEGDRPKEQNAELGGGPPPSSVYQPQRKFAEVQAPVNAYPFLQMYGIPTPPPNADTEQGDMALLAPRLPRDGMYHIDSLQNGNVLFESRNTRHSVPQQQPGGAKHGANAESSYHHWTREAPDTGVHAPTMGAFKVGSPKHARTSSHHDTKPTDLLVDPEIPSSFLQDSISFDAGMSSRHKMASMSFDHWGVSESPPDEVKGLIARLQVVFADKKEYRRLLASRGSTAKRLLDLFQRLLDVHRAPTPNFHRNLIVATQRLAGKSGLYPACYELTGVTIVGEHSESAGRFADIYKGSFRGRLVCLKTIRLDKKTQIDHLLKVCSKEAILWGQLSHPNLLPFFGMFRFKHRISLVAPWMEHGNVNEYLTNHPGANRVLLIFDVAKGLQYLHRNGIIHGDLKGANILIKESGRACIADFGISSISDREILSWTTHSAAASKGGSVRWQAPELFDPEGDEDIHNTVASDIYAWSCVAYEIFTGLVPFAHLVRDATVMFKVSAGERPIRPPESSPTWSAWGLKEHIWTLMQDCWKTRAEDRPTIDSIVMFLEGIVPEDSRMIESDGGLSPAQFREIARQDLHHDEMSVETLESLLDASLAPFFITPHTTASIRVVLEDVAPSPPGSTSLECIMRIGPPGKFYSEKSALALLDTVRTLGPPAKVGPDPSSTMGEQRQFELFHSRLSSGELFVAFSGGVEVLAFCSSDNTLIAQRLNISPLLHGEPGRVLVARVVIEKYAAYADAALDVDRNWALVGR